jgi:hypothetical protein
MGNDPCETSCPPCPEIFECTQSRTLSQVFTRNNCPIGSSPAQATYTVTQNATAFSTLSLVDACLKAGLLATDQAQADIAGNGQAFANSNAVCIDGPPECIGHMSLNVLTLCPQCIGTMTLDIDTVCPPIIPPIPPCIGTMTLDIDTICDGLLPPSAGFLTVSIVKIQLPNQVVLGECTKTVTAVITNLPEGCIVTLQPIINGNNFGASVQATVVNGIATANFIRADNVSTSFGWKVLSLSCVGSTMINTTASQFASCS